MIAGIKLALLIISVGLIIKYREIITVTMLNNNDIEDITVSFLLLRLWLNLIAKIAKKMIAGITEVSKVREKSINNIQRRKPSTQVKVARLSESKRIGHDSRAITRCSPPSL